MRASPGPWAAWPAGPRLLGALLGALCILNSSCTSMPPPRSADASLFDDAAFGPPSVRIAADDVIALSPAMRRHLVEEIVPALGQRPAHTGLVELLYTRNQLQLTYDAEMTRNAAEAFDARSGNCLSLVLMTAAFARELGLQVRYQTVLADETWARDGNLVMVIDHVNVSLGRRTTGVGMSFMNTQWLTVDFLPSAELQRQRGSTIDESRVISMYMNNKAAEALASGRLDDAYAWVRGALAQDAGFGSAYNTLGVVYLRHGQPLRAQAALQQALSLDMGNVHALSNLVLALRAAGRHDEAQTAAARLERLQPDTPFGQHEMGLTALRRGDLASARRHFERALRDGGDFHEFHHALAQVLARQGDARGAARELELAAQSSGTRRLQALYAGKLQRLRDATAH